MPASELPASTVVTTAGAATVEPNIPPGWPHWLCPNFSDWQLGDIVLVKSNGSPKDRGIAALQYVSLSPATRAGFLYIHAAIYVGNGEIVDITAKGVAKRSVWTYCEHHAITLRRSPDVTQPEQGRIVQFALDLLVQGQPYSWTQLVQSKLIADTVPKNNGLYCSTLVGLAYDKAGGVQLHSQPFYRPLYPATLAEHLALDVVPLEWRPIV